jgi:hypothetical protein
MRKSIPLSLLILLLVPACAAKTSEPPIAQWSNFRIAVFRDQIGSIEQSCDVQHLKEHVYSQKLYNHLSKEKNLVFRIDAVSSLDRIAVSIDIFGKNIDRDKVTKLIEQGLEGDASADLVKREAILVDYEEELLSTNDQVGARALQDILSSADAEIRSNCSTFEMIQELRKQNSETSDSYSVYQLNGDNIYTELTSKNVSRSDQLWGKVINRINWSDIPKSHPESTALFVTFEGSRSIAAHKGALLQIYSSLDDVGIARKQLRPFGKAGFLVFDQREKLEQFRSSLEESEIVGNPNNDASLNQAADNYICQARYSGSPEVGLHTELITHPYFEFAIKPKVCADIAPVKGRVFSKMVTASQLDSNPNSIALQNDTLDVEVCARSLSNALSNADALAVGSLALRRHIRNAQGLALNAAFGKVRGSCVSVKFYAPAEFHEKLHSFIRDFDARSFSFQNDVRSSVYEHLCRKNSGEPCSTRVKPDDLSIQASIRGPE